jgi:predicted nuclease of predicted toxin-antitoxin system
MVEFLRTAGHDVVYVAESGKGLSDADVVTLASRETRLLLTEDKDFGDLVFRRERTVPGVVLLRIGSENPALKAIRLQAAIDRYGDGLLGRYTVIEGGRFRSRPLWSTTSP